VDRVAPELHAIVPIHWVLHVVSGAAYVHALLVILNGKVVPARLVWLVRLAYVFMVEEILLTYFTGSERERVLYVALEDVLANSASLATGDVLV
jgi:hypothetical protein